jgi:hypothetical protein
MTSRDTHDIEEYEREKARMEIADRAYRECEMTGKPSKIPKSANIQPGLVVKLMAASEPCLFSNKNPIEVKPVVVDPKVFLALGQMLEAAKFHAEYQIEFWKELQS